MGVQLFLSYSRSDYPSARLLFEILTSRLHCHTFMDVVNDSIPLGAEFPKAVEQAIASSSALILLMGKAWISRKESPQERPIDNPDSWVRKEVAIALRERIRIIPVMIDGVVMPSAGDLPKEISLLSYYHGISIRDAEFDRDVEPLIETLERIVGSEALLPPDPKLLVADVVYYFHRFAKLIVMPKRVVHAFTATRSGELAHSLMFLVISLAMYSFFTVPLYIDRPRMGVVLFVQFGMLFMMVLCSSAILQLSWRLVGGSASFAQYLSLTSYYFGVNLVLGICIVAAALGVITLFDPSLLRVLRVAAEGDIRPLISLQPFSRSAFCVAVWVVVAGNALLLVWTYAFWGSYREINGVGRFYSFMAFLIANVISLPVGVVFVLIQAFLFNRLQSR